MLGALGGDSHAETSFSDFPDTEPFPAAQQRLITTSAGKQ